MILDHKKRFRETVFGKLWHEASEAEWFQQGLQTALLEFRKQLPPSQDLGAAAANEFRSQGADKLISVILNLTENQPEPKPRVHQNLDPTR